MPAGYRCMAAYWIGGAGQGLDIVVTEKLQDARQCIKRSYNPATNKLKMTHITSASVGGTQQDWQNVIKNVFNEVTDTLRISQI